VFRFLIRVGAFALAGMACLALVSAVLLPKDGGQDPAVADIRLANTGNSHGMYAIDYSLLPTETLPTYNFAMESQSLVYDDRLIDYFSHHFAEEGSVLFVLVDLTALWYEETNDADFNAKNERYLPIIGARNMRFASTFETILYRYFYALTCMDRWTGTMFRIEAEEGSEKTPQLTRYTREEIGKMRSQHHLSHILYADGSLRPMNETNLAALRHLLDTCREENIRPILLTTPYYRSYTDCVPETVREAVTAVLTEIADSYGIAWWDYFTAEPYNSNETCFNDTDHLSEEGRALFMEELCRRLVAEGYFTAEELG